MLDENVIGVGHDPTIQYANSGSHSDSHHEEVWPSDGPTEPSYHEERTKFFKKLNKWAEVGIAQAEKVDALYAQAVAGTYNAQKTGPLPSLICPCTHAIHSGSFSETPLLFSKCQRIAQAEKVDALYAQAVAGTYHAQKSGPLPSPMCPCQHVRHSFSETSPFSKGQPE